MNSPETPIYSKSNILYHLDRAKDAIRQRNFAILVEGYMDTIAVARGGFANVVASCGTSLAEPQAKLLSRFTKNVIVNYDPDTAGQAATERSFAVLLEKEFEIKVLMLPGGADPDKFLKENGAAAYEKQLSAAPSYIDFLISRARHMDRSTATGKLGALNYLMPYVQRVPNRLIRSEWASRIASELRVDEPVLREALRRASVQRHSEVKPKAELVSSAMKQADRRLMQMLVEAEDFREKLAHVIVGESLHKGLDTERIFEVLLATAITGAQPDPAALAESLAEPDRRLFFSVVFESAAAPSWDEAESCLIVLRRRHIETELQTVQKEIEAQPAAADLNRLLTRKQELRKRLSG
jgi:DNA primase